MDIEHLNTTQVILLTLLVSFVTSIATGIVTVTLLAQAPPGVTQTINRVVERTKEVVTQAASPLSVKETTLVVKEDDLITDSIEKNRGALVRIIARTDSTSGASSVVGIGALVDAGGIVATARNIFSEGSTYTALDPAGNELSIQVLNLDSTSSVALFQLLKKDTKFQTATIPSPLSVKLGQTVLALGGEERAEVATGIVSGLEQAGNIATGTIMFIDSNIDAAGILPGSPLLNIFGETIGIRTVGVPLSGSAYIPSSVITAELRALPKPSTSH